MDIVRRKLILVTIGTIEKINVNNEVNLNFHGCTVLLQGVLQTLQVFKVIIYRFFS